MFEIIGDHGRIRTCDLQFRKRAAYLLTFFKILKLSLIRFNAISAYIYCKNSRRFYRFHANYDKITGKSGKKLTAILRSFFKSAPRPVCATFPQTVKKSLHTFDLSLKFDSRLNNLSLYSD